MENLAGDEGRGFQIQHCPHDLVYHRELPPGVQSSEGGGRVVGVCGGVDDGGRHRVYPDSTPRVLLASDVVAAIRPPSVIGQRRRNVDVGVFGPGVGVNVTT